MIRSNGCRLNAPIRRIDKIIVNETRKARDKPKGTWLKAIKNDMITIILTEEIALHRAEWENKMHVADNENSE